MFIKTEQYLFISLSDEADHSPPSSVKVKNVWSYTSTPQYVFMVQCLLKHRADFTLVRFVAFPATEYDEVLSGYQLGQMVEQ
jgi:hypothetical protein